MTYIIRAYDEWGIDISGTGVMGAFFGDTYNDEDAADYDARRLENTVEPEDFGYDGIEFLVEVLHD